MGKLTSYTVALLCLLPFLNQSCTSKNNFGDPVAEPSAISKDILTFLRYRDKNVQLYKTFIGIDPTNNSISKDKFLKLLSTGHYIPLKLRSLDSNVYYQLSPLAADADPDIKTTIKEWGQQAYDYYKLEGKDFPDFHFTDMTGKSYDKASTRGKIIVLKCWFLACVPCVKEIPILNQLRQKYQHRDDILFISLCWDSKNKVAEFLKNTPFQYSTVPDQYKFLTETLMLNGYPTHFIITKEGKIFKKTQDNREMIYSLQQLLSK